MKMLKVSSHSKPNSVAAALAGSIREEGEAGLQAIGAKAVNQAVKAVAIARGYVAPNGIDLFAVPSFTDVVIEGKQRTAIRIQVKPRYRVIFAEKHRAEAEEEERFEETSEVTPEETGEPVEMEEDGSQEEEELWAF